MLRLARGKSLTPPRGCGLLKELGLDAAHHFSGGLTMPKYLCINSLPPKAVTLDQVKQVSQAAQQDNVVKGRRSFGNLTEGKVACVFEAPSKQDVANFFASKGMPV